MNSFKEIETKANELFIKFNLIGWRFAFDNAKRRMGCCSYRNRTISMSRPLCEVNMGREKLMDTLLHEMAHAIAKQRTGVCQGHNDVWKRICVEIGANPQRCYTSEQVTAVKSKYEYKCPNCGKLYRRHKRMTKQTSCGDCCRKYNGGRYSKEYIFVLDKQNW